MRTWEHRNILYNSVPVYLADRQDELTKYRIAGGHFIFSDETDREIGRILDAYRRQAAPTGPVRRIAVKTALPGEKNGK